ncbi:hypothetical protein RJ640_020162 [Escallonia rubra]|uniref:Uncharacterized protein n=1 Tax=Escallonia rubra TaxID=112253 RepID=A0AA88U7A9_9ASTE|nr:hypothetical protein RJ640_020162 [Escallonia rubra]
MAVSFTRFSWWYWSGKEKEPVASGSSLNSSSDWGLGLRETDSLKFPKVKGTKMASSSRKVKRKWHSREERRIDKEYDVVLVPSDGVCLSGSESDDSDWSIGWLEPHAPDFQSDEEGDDSFAVLVPCYRNDLKEVEMEPNNQLLSAIKNLPAEYSAALCALFCNNYVMFTLLLDLCFISRGQPIHGAVAFYSPEFLKPVDILVFAESLLPFVLMYVENSVMVMVLGF